MKDLNFSITLNNHTFNIRTNIRHTLCSYVIDGKYKTSLVFGSNTYANVTYKNAIFSSTVTKQNIWKLWLDTHIVIQKRYNMFYFETTKQKQNVETEKTTSDKSLYYSENILHLYEIIIKELSELYSNISDKTSFKNQLCDYFQDVHYDFIDPNEILEYEYYESDCIDEEPVIERITAIDEVINDVKEFFVSFRQAEMDSNLVFTVEDIIKEVPELHKISHTFLSEELKNYLAKYNDELIKPDIYYDKSDKIYHIAKHLFDTYQYSVFIGTLEEKINKILSDIDNSVIDKEEIYAHFKTYYSSGHIPDDEDLAQSIKDYVRAYIDFYNLYHKFVDLFESDEIKVIWDDKTIQLFEKYDKKEISVDSQYFEEYEVYRYVIPYYRKHFFRKNSNKYKPVIDKLPGLISYATSIYDILFKYRVLIDTEDKVIYDEDGDIKSAYEEMITISIN